YSNDIDPRKRDMYRAHFGDGLDLRDIHKIPARDIPRVTLATASFPCNDLSLAGSRAGLARRQSSALLGLVELLEGIGSRPPPPGLARDLAGVLSSPRA